MLINNNMAYTSYSTDHVEACVQTTPRTLARLRYVIKEKILAC